MEMVGEARLLATRERVWELLNDPISLRASIPGCESLERLGESSFAATVVSKVGPIKARFAGKVTLSNVIAPRSYTLTGEGSGGAAGFAKAEIDVTLDALEPQLTLLRYAVSATVGGKLAQLGSRMIDAAARKSADDFFELFAQQVNAQPGAAVPSTPQLNLGDLAGPAVGVPTAPARPAAHELPPTPTVEPATTAEVMDVLGAELIKVWISDQIAVVTLNRPANRNAMTYGMWRAMPSVFGALERNPEVRALILTGSGSDFCAGADIAEFATVRDDASQAARYEVAVDACCHAIANISKPTIAVIRGYCLGGGAHLAMSCDFRYAAAEAVFGIPAARLSIIYGVQATRKLLGLVGLPVAKKILYGAQRFTAAEGLEIGFLDHVAITADPAPAPAWRRWFGAPAPTPPGDPTVDAREFARQLADNAPLSIAGAKTLLNGMAMGTGALDLLLAQALIDAASASHDYREGRAAFAEKRTPRFQGH